MTAGEIREKIISTVAENGGHLASSLGAVELSMALAEVFDPVKDRIVWDVGHQAYAWKILTGRADRFSTLRRYGGISGFPNPAESPADAAVAGHAGVALSVALGYAAARDLKKSDENIVAVVGDSSLVNGTSLEAINATANATKKVILVLNDNGMSISKPKGSVSRFLGRLISGVRYNRVKTAAENAGHALKLTFLRDIYHGLESRIKSLFLGSRPFELFGFRYVGPVDGHDLQALKDAFTVAKNDKRSVVVHVVTKKGKGFAPAELHPTAWHGVGPFDRAKAEAGERIPAKSDWSAAFGEAMTKAAYRDSRIVALTAGMAEGTGLMEFAKLFPERFFDTGITEGHMVAFAAGLAAGGKRPVVAVYSTFLQRAIDQVVHDVALARLPVIFCIDRAGVVGADGATHQGVFDLAMLRPVPNLVICEPKDREDLAHLIDEALLRGGPTVIRYPRGVPHELPPAKSAPEKPSFAIWATGDWLWKAEEVASRLGGEAVHARYLKPFNRELLERERKAGMKIVSLENGSVKGGLGEAMGADLKLGWPDRFIPHGKPEELEKVCSLDVDSIECSIKACLNG